MDAKSQRRASSIWVIQILYQVILFSNIAPRTAPVSVLILWSQNPDYRTRLSLGESHTRRSNTET
jgi:hypothetical protein